MVNRTIIITFGHRHGESLPCVFYVDLSDGVTDDYHTQSQKAHYYVEEAQVVVVV